VPAYAVRPRPGAPVATPLHWPEVDEDALRPDRWTLANVRDRLDAEGDPWAHLPRAAGPLPRLG
jgi:bifunctional non-homologous end joining protein LigD